MKTFCILSMVALSAVSAQEGFKPLFNGKDLTGWDGNPELWSVQDGCITGKTTGPEQLKYNQFLIWRGGVVKNFELRAKVRVSASNSGIQYRSREIPESLKWSVGGYQCDIHPGAPNNAMLYGEKWGGILGLNGQSVVIDPEGQKWLVGETEQVKVDIAQWHDYTIIAQGNHLIHKIDGKVAVDLMDFGAKTQLLEGILAFQLHQGPAMVLQVKEVLLKELPEGGAMAFDAAKLPAHAKRLEDPKNKVQAKPKAGAVAANGVIAPEDIKTLADFKVELIHKVAKESEGSWVGLTIDDKGRLIAADQYGGLFRLTPTKVGSGGETRVEKLSADVNGAHGLLYAFDSLYVLVNEKPNVAGLYRLRDTKGTGQFDEKTLLREINGHGEHGNHSITLSPDGKSLYITCGNTTAPPQLEHTRGSRPLKEDQVVPCTSRAVTFSDNRPNAITCKVSPDGKRFELIVAGLRNHFDTAFNVLGDLFTYDSDMELDAGTPWFRPTRIYHLVSGGDYGFRDNSGKLPAYFPDTVPPLVEVGPGSPTGVVSGLGAAFPAKYQHAIYACDWTYGTLYAVHLTPKGAGYEAKLEEFLYGKPLPLTDAVIGKDGAMYFAIGGRLTQSAVYRVTYEGKESTAPAAAPVETPEHKLRVELEGLHEEGTGPEAIEKAWPYLNHADRLVRYAARVAIERQPANLWAARALKQTEPWGVIEGGVALARIAGKEHQAALFEMLNALDFAQLDNAQQLALVRAYQISISRNGLPVGDPLTKTIARLDAVFPAKTNDLNTELSRTLAALGSSEVVAKTVQLMRTAKDDPVSWLSAERMGRNDGYGRNFLRPEDTRPNTQQIAYAYGIRFVQDGWTPELRREFFTWFGRTGPWLGGYLFRGFIETIRKEALASVPDADERAKLAVLATPKVLAINPESIRPPKGPGKAYTVDEVTALSAKVETGRDFLRGRDLFIAAACQTCHRLGDEGGGVGPDLTAAANRYTLRDLVENIVDPNKVISDQYENSIIVLSDGSTVIGRITAEEGDLLHVATNPSAPGQLTMVHQGDIQSRKVSPTSIMPPGLLNAMNPDEVADLLAYVLSGGDKKAKMFTK